MHNIRNTSIVICVSTTNEHTCFIECCVLLAHLCSYAWQRLNKAQRTKLKEAPDGEAQTVNTFMLHSPCAVLYFQLPLQLTWVRAERANGPSLQNRKWLFPAYRSYWSLEDQYATVLCRVSTSNEERISWRKVTFSVCFSFRSLYSYLYISQVTSLSGPHLCPTYHKAHTNVICWDLMAIHFASGIFWSSFWSWLFW